MAGGKYLKITAYVTALIEFLNDEDIFQTKIGPTGASTADQKGKGGVGEGQREVGAVEREVGAVEGGWTGGEEWRYDIVLHEPGFLHLLPALLLERERAREREGVRGRGTEREGRREGGAETERQTDMGGEGEGEGEGEGDRRGEGWREREAAHRRRMAAGILCVSDDAVQAAHLRRCAPK